MMRDSFWCATAWLHLKTFATFAAYLRREERGLAGGSPWPCDLDPIFPAVSAR